MKKTTKSWLLIALLAGSLWLPAFAHQQKAAVTRVLFNARSGNLEVMHRFYLHDAEHAVRQILDGEADILGSETTQQGFADYVAQRFSLSLDGKAVELDRVGFEVDGGFFWIYQETAMPTQSLNLTIRHDALRELWPSQSNLVNIEGRGEVVSLRFGGEAREQTVSLPATES